MRLSPTGRVNTQGFVLLNMGSFFSRRRKQPKVNPKKEPEQNVVSAVTEKPTVSAISIGDAFVSDRHQELKPVRPSPENKKRREQTLLAARKDQEAGSIVKQKHPGVQSEYFDLPGAVPGNLEDSPDEDNTNAESTMGRLPQPTANLQSNTRKQGVIIPQQKPHEHTTTSLFCIPVEPPASGEYTETGEQEDENSNIIKEGTALAEFRNVDLFGGLADEEFSRLDLKNCSLLCSEDTHISATSRTDLSDELEERQRSQASISQSEQTAREPGPTVEDQVSAEGEREQPPNVFEATEGPRSSVRSKTRSAEIDPQAQKNASLADKLDRRVRIESEKEDSDFCPRLQRSESPSIDEIVACSLEQIMQSVYTTEALEVGAVTGTDWKALTRQLVPPDLAISTVSSRHRPSSTKYCEDCTVDILDQGNDEGDGEEVGVRAGYDEWEQRLQDEVLMGDDGEEAELPVDSDTDIAEDTLDCNVDDRTPSPPVIEDIAHGRSDQNVADATAEVDSAASDIKGSQRQPEDKELIHVKTTVQDVPGDSGTSKHVDDFHEGRLPGESKAALYQLEVTEMEAVTTLPLTDSLPKTDGGEDMCKGGGDSLSYCTDQSKDASTEENHIADCSGRGRECQQESISKEVTEDGPYQHSMAEQGADATETGRGVGPEGRDSSEPLSATQTDVSNAN